MTFTHSQPCYSSIEARRYVEQQIHSPCTETRQRRLSNAASDQSTRPVQTLSSGPLSTMFNNSYLQKAYLERTTVPYTSITEEEYRLCISTVLRPPLPAETDRIEVRNPSTTVAGKPLKIQMGTTRIQIYTKVSCSFL